MFAGRRGAARPRRRSLRPGLLLILAAGSRSGRKRLFSDERRLS